MSSNPPIHNDSGRADPPGSRRLPCVALFLVGLFILGKLGAQDLYELINREDGVIEYLQTGIYLASALLAGTIGLRFARKPLRLFALMYFVLASGLFFISLEEIGWGHRLLDYTVPDFFQTQNIQKEVSLHNLDRARSFVNEAYIFVSFYGAFAWYFLPRLLPGLRHPMAGYLIPKKQLLYFFLPAFLFYFYLVCGNVILARWTGINAFFVGFEQSRYVINFIDQEPVELLLALGFLFFLIENVRRQRTQKFKAATTNATLLKPFVTSLTILGVLWHLFYTFLSTQFYPYDYLERGNQLFLQGLIEESLAQYNAALQIAPGLAAAHNNLGRSFLSLNKYEAAAEQFGKAVQLNPNGAAEKYNLGLVRRLQGDLNGARSLFMKSLELDPDMTRAHLDLGNTYLQMNQFKQAILPLSRAIEAQSSENPSVYNNLGYACAMSGQPERALNYYNHALQLRPDYLDAQLNLSNLLASQGKLDQAAARLEAILHNHPDCAKAYHNLGNLSAIRGRQSEALVLYAKAIEFQADYKEAWYHRGVVLRQVGRHDQAVQHLRKALLIDPNFRKARRELIELEKSTSVRRDAPE